MLGVQYGMEVNALASRTGGSPALARELLRAHRETYRIFWRWSQAAVDTAMLTGTLNTVFGWRVGVGDKIIHGSWAISRCRQTGLRCCG